MKQNVRVGVGVDVVLKYITLYCIVQCCIAWGWCGTVWYRAVWCRVVSCTALSFGLCFSRITRWKAEQMRIREPDGFPYAGRAREETRSLR